VSQPKLVDFEIDDRLTRETELVAAVEIRRALHADEFTSPEHPQVVIMFEQHAILYAAKRRTRRFSYGSPVSAHDSTGCSKTKTCLYRSTRISAGRSRKLRVCGFSYSM
jgi:hypothetical protein